MTGAEFGRALVVGFVATFVATVYGYWEVAIGLLCAGRFGKREA